MKIIQPEAHILPMTGDILKHVERCGRIAYKSEDAITDVSYVKFIQHLIQRGHESVLEHGNYVFEVSWMTYHDIVDRYNLIVFEEQAHHGRSGRMRFTRFDNRCVVSGNIRAWRDFIRAMQINLIEVPAWLCNIFTANPAFSDLWLIAQPTQEWYKQLQREDLTPAEQRIHWTETVHFTCSRAISHELVRHRALSPTQESQRYVNYSKGRFGGEITFIEPLWVKSDEQLKKLWTISMDENESEYMGLIQYGLQPQEAREVLPNSTKTEVVMTGTIGEWMHFFDLRCADDAHPEMRRIAKPLHGEFSENYAI
jgi:thymidylate synthase (FAD)